MQHSTANAGSLAEGWWQHRGGLMPPRLMLILSLIGQRPPLMGGALLATHSDQTITGMGWMGEVVGCRSR